MANEFPEEIPQSLPAPAAAFHRVKGEYAVHGGSAAAGAQPVAVFQDSGIEVSVYKGDMPAGDPACTPVYALAGNGPRAVPTGRVLVRFADDLKFEEQAGSLQNAGFQPGKALSYAANAGWVRSASGRVAEALQGLQRLSGLPGVHHVEPQMISARVSKQ